MKRLLPTTDKAFVTNPFATLCERRTQFASTIAS